MCGIVGFVGFENLDNKNIIHKMTMSLSHRGPDFNSNWINKDHEVALGHTRLSIFDLSTKGNQPMHSMNKRYIIVFNGEIYNFNEIKKNLNLQCISTSDTEVLLESISKIGLKKTLGMARGMFAFALYDKESKVLFLCRDRVGEKPLYYGWINNTFVFSSQLKAFKCHPNFDNSISRDSLSLLVKYNYIPSPNSIYADIYKLEPGKILSIKNKCEKINFDNNRPISNKNFSIEDYWNLKSAILNSNNKKIDDHKTAIKTVENELSNVVKMQSFADVPVGAFLSGGIDSTLITSLMQANSSKKINTFTIGSYDERYNEAEYAKTIAKHLNTNHTELYFDAKDAINIIPNISNIYDEPFADSSQLPTILISKLTKEHVKVSLSGDGGDELFGGYNRYLKGPKLWNLINLMPNLLKNGSSNILNKISNSNYNKIENILNFFLADNKKINFLSTKVNRLSYRLNNINSRNELYMSLVTEWPNFNDVVLKSKEPYNFLSHSKNLDFLDNFEQEMMYSDTLTYLPDDILTKVDRATMSVGLESRSPFLDHKIVELSWMINNKFKINNGLGKIILRDILYKYVPKNLIERPKQGFGIPLATWLRGPLKDWANDLLNENKIKSQNYFDYKLIRNRFESHIKGENNWEHSLWSILMFQAWNENNK